VHQFRGDHEPAVADFGKALQLDPQCILAGWHQNFADSARRRTTQLLADYIEGLRPALPIPASAKRRNRLTQVKPEPAAETTEAVAAATGTHRAADESSQAAGAAATMTSAPTAATASHSTRAKDIAEDAAAALLMTMPATAPAPTAGADAPRA